MTVVLREHEWAARAIEKHELGRKPFETLTRIARYYINEGMSKAAARQELDKYLLSCDPNLSLVLWEQTLDNAVKLASKTLNTGVSYIDITKPEIEKIKQLKGKQVQRLAFTLLVLSKYWNSVRPGNDGWVNNDDREIMPMANIRTSVKRQNLMYHVLYENGYVNLSHKIAKLNTQVLFAEDGETAIRVMDLRNLGYQYLMHCGEPFYRCSQCGLVVKMSDVKNKRNQSLCPDCAASNIMKRNISYIASDRPYVVYMHECPNGKRYVGCTNKYLSQCWRHGDGYFNNSALAADIERYGWENFDHFISTYISKETIARKVVAAYIKKYQSDDPAYGYNRKPKNFDSDDNLTILEQFPLAECAAM